MKRLTKEFDISTSPHFRLIYGTLNRLKPTIVYIELKGWVNTVNNENGSSIEDLSAICRSLKSNIKQKVCASADLDNKFIFDFNVAASSQNKSSKHFLTIEVFFKQIHDYSISLIKNKVCELINDPLRHFEDSLGANGLEISPHK